MHQGANHKIVTRQSPQLTEQEGFFLNRGPNQLLAYGLKKQKGFKGGFYFVALSFNHCIINKNIIFITLKLWEYQELSQTPHDARTQVKMSTTI